MQSRKGYVLLLTQLYSDYVEGRMDQVCMTGQPVKVGLHGIRFTSNNFSPVAKRLSLLTHTDVTCSLSSGHFFPSVHLLSQKKVFVFGLFVFFFNQTSISKKKTTKYLILNFVV